MLMTEMTPEDIKHVRSAFRFRMGYVAVLWIVGILALNTWGPSSPRFGTVITILTFALPIAMALIAPMDWRWLNKHPRSVNRFGLRMGVSE